MTTSDQQPLYRFRCRFTLGLLLLAAVGLGWRIVDLHVLRHDFLQGQGDARSLRVVAMAAHRGMITDRHGEPLAISTPIDSVWANPQELLLSRERLPELAKVLKTDSDKLQQKLASRRGREFVYLKRHIHPDMAEQVDALGLSGVSLQREYRRYYPGAEVTGHMVGFTNIDDEGQEGIELAYDDWLRGQPGSKRVLKDRIGHIVENVESIRVPQPGGSLALSIDRRIQYLAYSELKAAVQKHKARSGSAVVLDIKTGEVLAMVNQPTFNPNNRSSMRSDHYRNRVVTDVFEPGSTLKPFTVAAALESGEFNTQSQIQTAPGFYKVGSSTVKDHKNYGLIDVSTVLQKSSNVGASKMALALTAEQQWDMLTRVGFGEITSSGFPGESSGLLTDHRKWREIDRATLSFGYGISTTLLQLAQAYGVFATDGYLRTLSLQRIDKAETVIDNQQQVIDKDVAIHVRKMLERVVQPGGTATQAAVPGYRVAGKTGTVRKSGVGGYVEDRYLSLFAGFAPVSKPRLVMVVMVNEPTENGYYGGVVAAPVFSKVMAGALRLLNIAPDALPETNGQVIASVNSVGVHP